MPVRHRPYVAVASAATLAAGILSSTPDSASGRPADLARFLGPLPAPLTVAAAGVAGFAALRLLEARGFWREPSRRRTVRALVVASAAALPLAGLAIAVDVVIGFPADINAPWPRSLLVYPSIAVVAETVFHLVPLALAVWAGRSHFSGKALDQQTWALILAVALVEPVAQVALGSALPLFVVPHVYAIGVVQLILLRRSGYLPMMWFRIVYYLLWHVLWGTLRLA